MIELPSDLAEVLKTVQKNENGADIVFPNGNEDLLADLASAWDNWNKVAESRIQAIIDAAKRAMEHMSGPAAEQYEQYLQKYAGRDDSHAATTLLAGQAMASNLHGAARAVAGTKQEMVRELAYAKEYIQQHPEGKHDDIAKSEGIKTAAQTYHTYIGQVGSGVDGMLRQSAGHIESMTGAGKSCALGGGGGAGGSGGGAGGPGSARVGLDGLSPNSLPGALGPNGLPVGLTAPDGTGANGLPGALGPNGLPSGLGPAGLGGPGPIGLGGPGGGGPFGGGSGSGGFGSGGSGSGGSGSGGSGGGGAGGGGTGGSGSSGVGARTMPTIPHGQPPTMPDFDGAHGGASGIDFGMGGHGPQMTSPRIQPFVPPQPTMPDFSGTLPDGTSTHGGEGCLGPDGKPVFGSDIGKPKLDLAGLGDIGVNTGPSTGGLTPFGGGPGPSLGFGPGSLGGGPGGGGGGGGLAAGLGAGGLGSALGSSLSGALGGAGSATGAGASSLAGAGAAASRLGAGTGTGVGSAAGKAGVGGVGSGTAAATAGRPGAAGMHAPGGFGGARGGGKNGGKNGNRFVRPTRFGCEGEEEEEALRTDSGVIGQATELEPRDKSWHKMRQRWVDEARTSEHPAAHEAEVAGPTGAESPLVAQLASAILGTPTEGSAEGASAADPKESAGESAGGSAIGRSGSSGSSGSSEPAATAEPTGAAGGGDADDAYLDRSRSVAARRGRPEESAPASGGTAATPAPTATRPAPLREEEGFQVPSPFLRAALERLAAAGGGGA